MRQFQLTTMHAGSTVGSIMTQGAAAELVFQGGKLIYSQAPVMLPETSVRMVTDPDGLWMEFFFLSPEELSGNTAAGFRDAGNYAFVQLQQSTDLATWNLGRFIPCDPATVEREDGTVEYWARSTVPAWWNNVICDLTATCSRYGKSITGISIGGTAVTLPNYPYAMPAAAATLQTDLRAAGYTGAVVSSASAALSVDIIRYFYADDAYYRQPFGVTLGTGGVTEVRDRDQDPISLPNYPYAMPSARAALQADLRTAGHSGATVRLFADEWSIFLPDRPAATPLDRAFYATFTPTDPHPNRNVFGEALPDVADDIAPGTSGNIRSAGLSPLMEATKQFARLAISPGSR